jgi:hypothetical protein
MTKTQNQKKRAKAQKKINGGGKPPPLPIHSKREDQLARQLQELRVSTRGRKNGILDENVGALLRRGGNMLGSFIGQPTLFGMGAYKMSRNSLWESGSQTPSMHSTSEKLVFRHKEFITNVAAGGIYAPFYLNPGNPAVFPYLSNIASNFEEYMFRGLVFHYKSTSATAITSGTNTALGTVSLSCQYRADALPPTSRQALLGEMWSVDVKVSDDVYLPIECDPRENPLARLYIRTFADNVPVGGDIKTFDIGKVNMRVDGYQAGQTNVVGELWVSYEVELYKPTLVPGLIGLPLHMGFSTINHSNANPMGNSFYASTIDQDQWTVDFVNNIVYFPNVNAQYWLSLVWSGNVAVNAVSPTLVGTGGLNVLAAGASDDSVAGKSSYTLFVNAVVTTVAGLTIPILTFGTGGTLPTTPTGFFFNASQVAPLNAVNAYGNIIRYYIGGVTL